MKHLWLTFFSVLSFSAALHAAEAELPVQQQLDDYLLGAARQGDQAILEEFIKADYDLNTQNAKGYTALILAAYNGQLASVEQLLAAGADPCVEDVRGNTALMGAIFKGEVRIAKRLLQSTCSPNQRNAAGQTPAMYAALFQRMDILDELKQRGADLEAEDAMGNRVSNLLQGEFAPATPSR